MTLRTKYMGFVVVLHVVEVTLSYWAFKHDMSYFFMSEGIILLSLGISWRLYKDLVQPIRLLAQGVEAIKDKDFNVKFLTTGKNEVDELISVYNQMIDALRLEKINQEQQHFFLEKLIQTSPTGIMILDFDNKVQQINPTALFLLGLEEADILKKAVSDSLHPVMIEVATLLSGDTKTLTLNGGITYKLQKSHFVDRGFPRHFIMLEELTAEILAAEKKAYGKVIRLMAHEVNNTIGPVNSILQSTLQAGQTNILAAALQVALDRNNNLNFFMRNFADLVRLPVPEKRPFDVRILLEKISNLLQFKAKEHQVTICLEPAVPMLMIHADEHQIEQALINVVTNAIEAIEGAGTVTLIMGRQPDRLIVRDTGTGIPASFEPLLFSPFNSTKKNGQGIGLTLVREILVSHGFEFSLRTVALHQTEFSILFH